MIGAIKRRWKSKKTKVVHKGSDLSSSTDSCPTSRGFVNGCEEFEKILKPPSPRQIQIHPVLEKGEVKQQQQQQQKPYFKKKCSTLPPASEGPGHPFIRVNSGRIELVNKESSPMLSSGQCRTGIGVGGGGHIVLSNGNDMSTVEKLRRLGGRLRNENRRSSWCGSAIRDGLKKNSGGTPSLLMEEQVGRRGPVAIPVSGSGDSKIRLLPSKSRSGTFEAQAQTGTEMELKVYRLLEERLGVIEGLTGTLQNWQKEERCEYERCMSELATQVSRAVALQQLMKSEVERLQQRVVDLETHNKAMTTMIVPTLMKLHGAIGRETGNPGTKKVTAGTGTFTSCSRDREPERLTQSLERKGSQKPSVKSPKQRKIDCRIPARINSNKVSRPNPPKQASELEKKTKVESNKSSTTTTPNSIREDEVLLSSPTSSKSESSSSAPLPYKSKGVRSSSSSYSGIPRMASPRPIQQGIKKATTSSKDSTGFALKNRKLESETSKPANSSSGVGSRLPVRRNLSNSISSPLEKIQGQGSRSSESGERTTNSLTFLRRSPAKINSNSPTSTAKSAGNCSIPSTPAVPKAGKDEGYSTMSSEALAEQENAEKCQSQNMNFGMHKSNTFNTFLQSDNYRVRNEYEGTRSPKRINFTSLPTGAGRKTVVAPGPRTTVRIIRGITSYDVEMDGGETTEDPSTSTILWEDSDDSDILFLPLEMSSEASSSRSTLVPSSASFISANGLPNSRNSSSTTGNERDSKNLVRRSRGEELVALLAAHRGRGGEVDQDEMEERALIEKWMRLEDVRNEVQWDDEWAWDWDGVARTHKLSRVGVAPPAIEDDESEFWFSSKSPMRKTLEKGTCSTTSTTPIQIDSSTWTKSKKKTRPSCDEKEKARGSSERDLESNSPESLLEKVLDGDGNNELENEKGE